MISVGETGFHPAGHGRAPLVLNIAVLGFNLVTRVEAGENHGKQLHHDFTILGYKTASMSVSEDGYTCTTIFPHIAIQAPQSGIAVWINNEGDPTPLQATGGWIQ